MTTRWVATNFRHKNRDVIATIYRTVDNKWLWFVVVRLAEAHGQVATLKEAKSEVEAFLYLHNAGAEEWEITAYDAKIGSVVAIVMTTNNLWQYKVVSLAREVLATSRKLYQSAKEAQTSAEQWCTKQRS